MLTYLLKFLHILLALGLVGTVIYCSLSAIRNRPHTITHPLLIGLSLCALATGSLLVIPKHYTFTTPWIQAAYLFVGLFILVTTALFLLKKKNHLRHPLMSISSYILLITLLIIIIHDAVTKSTFLF